MVQGPLLGISIGLMLASGLGTPLRRDGYSFRPPASFYMTRLELFEGTRVGSPAHKEAARKLSAALVDGAGEEAASLLVTVVDESFELSSAARDELSTALVRHYSEELGLKFSMERAEAIAGAAPRVEVLGTVRAQNQARHVLVAAMAGIGRHTVLTFSVPSGRYEALRGAMRDSLETYRAEAPAGAGRGRELGAWAALSVAAALLISLGLWRRRRLLKG